MRERLGIMCLAAGFFFLPLGFDIAFYMVQEWTGSYAVATFLFYVLSALFFIAYFLLHKKNPVSHAKEKVKEKKESFKKVIKKKK